MAKGKAKKKSNVDPPPTLPSPSSSPAPPCHGNKLLKRFYEPLVLQHVLDEARGCHISSQPPDVEDESELENCKLRRSFVDMLAYLCDHKKGCATVTAIALEDRPEAVVFWVAANEDVREKVVLFLQNTLRNLAWPGLLNATSGSKEFTTAVEDISKSAVKFGVHRIKRYWQFMQDSLEKCIKVLEESTSQEDLQLKEWLMKFRDYSSDMEKLCRFSSETRHSLSMKEITRRSNKDSHSSDIDSNASRFTKVRHYIGRFGVHMKAARTLVAAAARPSFSRFFEDFQIKCCPSPKPAAPPPVNPNLTLENLVTRMLPKDDPNVSTYQSKLQFLDTRFKILRRLKEKYQDPSFLPIVHAELIVLEHFYTQSYKFVDGDKYIGCSKPACYCCYHYICEHPGNFVRPASHNKNYINWRPPDIVGDDPEGQAANRQRDVLNSVINKIRKDVLQQIDERRGPGNSHHDTVTGISESQATQYWSGSSTKYSGLQM